LRSRISTSPSALARGAVGAGGDVVGGEFEVGVGQDDGVVLGATESLDALAVGGGLLVDVLGDRRRPDEGDGLDGGVGEDGVDRVLAAVDDVEDAVGQACPLVEGGDEVGGRRVALGRLEDEGVAGRDGDGVHPQRHHRREVERRDARDDAAGDLIREGALQHVTEAAGELHDLAAAGDFAAGVVDGLAVFGGDDPAELLLVLHEQLAEVEHDLGALGERGFRPRLERGGRGLDRGVHVRAAAEDDLGLLGAGCRVEHRLGGGGGPLGEGAVDPVLDGCHGDVSFAGTGSYR
jgi:hypothetical protein